MEAKLVLLLALAGGLFLTIVLSYVVPQWQYAGLLVGLGIGLAGAVLLTIRTKRQKNDSD